MFGNQLVNKNFNLVKILLVLLLIFIDQITKFYIDRNFNLYESLLSTTFSAITFIVIMGHLLILNDPD